MEYNETVHQLLIDFQKACDSIRREVLYNILIEFGRPMKLCRLIKMRLNEAKGKETCGWITMNVREIQWGVIDETDLAEDRNKWWALVKMVMNIWVP
jgi:hypothetical protein